MCPQHSEDFPYHIHLLLPTVSPVSSYPFPVSIPTSHISATTCDKIPQPHVLNFQASSALPWPASVLLIHCLPCCPCSCILCALAHACQWSPPTPYTFQCASFFLPMPSHFFSTSFTYTLYLPWSIIVQGLPSPSAFFFPHSLLLTPVFCRNFTIFLPFNCHFPNIFCSWDFLKFFSF